MGEFKVHRVRFFDYMPSAIRALAFCRHTERLAAARADGSVEIFNFADNYFQEKVIPGRDRRAVEALCWVGPRLFSAGLGGEITEYDLENLRPRYSLEAYGGPVWSLSSNRQGTTLAAGCEDGTVKMFEILEERIQFQKNLERQKGRIVSLSWHPSGAQIAAGTMDMIRIFDTETGHATHRLLVERGAGVPKTQEVVVWSVVFLSDGTVISGDSAGKVQFWDGFMGTLLRTHLVTKWDVLVLSVSPDESSVIAGTSEGTVVQFQLVSSGEQQDQQWFRTRTFKNHSHDVKALVHTDTAVVSGGVDTQLVVRPLLDKVEKNTQEAALRKIVFPHRNLVSCAKKAGLLLFQFPDHLEVWRLGDSDGTGKPGDSLPVKREPEKLIQLNRKGRDHICCSALSPCGGWLAYSTVSGVRLYRLQLHNNISINKVSKLPKELQSVHQLCFSSDSSTLFASSSLSSIVVVGLDLDQQECKYLQTLKHKSGSKQPLHLLSPSEDGRWLATANTDCEIHVFNLHKMKLHCSVPVHGSCPTAISVSSSSGSLVSVHADQQILEFSLKQKEYTEWCRKLQRLGLHPRWLQRDTPVTTVTFNPSNPDQLVLNDTFMFGIIDRTQPLPEAKSSLFNQLFLRTLPQAKRSSSSHAFKICKNFQNLLCMALLEDGSLVVVERPLQDIVARLPAPVRLKKFAT
ncbi:U3 small nucleolar RNA-associated protein 4 homolog [Nematolebias whitei]|uniref:U3 small nucleolar RNA-associated protein 4 homolog n=1 Tax=Nematolebias whitei TaxID=451745 RepID=UPI0018981678|nr:U3 small nucleolar RNA-associated protein 4 homolog [Nematolebias whitei]